MVVLVLVITAFMLVLVTTTRATAADDFRGRASQLAAQEVERLRAVPWATAAVLPTTAGPTCVGGELARTVAAPGAIAQRTVADVSGRPVQVTNTVTWVGVACTSGQPTYGQLRLSTRVAWTDRGRARYLTITNFRVPPPEVLPPAAPGTPVATTTPSPSPSESAAASPSPSTTSTPASSSSPSPTPTFLAAPVFTDFSPGAPATFCVDEGTTIAPLDVTVRVTGTTAGEPARLTWTGPPASTSGGIPMTYGGFVSGKHVYSVSIPTGTRFSTGATQLQVGIAATPTHAVGSYGQTFSVTAAQNKNKC